MNIGGVIGIIIVGTIIAVIIYSAYSSYSDDQKYRAEQQRKKYGRLKAQIDAYHKHLTEECGYESPDEEYNPFLTADFDEYEEEYKKLGLKASVEINHMAYDIRESKINKLKIENDDLQHRLFDLGMQGFYIRNFLLELDENHSELLDNAWKEFTKKYKIEDVIPEWHYMRFDETISDEVDDVDVMVKHAEERGKPISEKRIKELKKQAELQEKQNKLLEDFIEYQKHKRCSGSTCRKGADIKKCKLVRKKFRSYEDDKFLNEIPF